MGQNSLDIVIDCWTRLGSFSLNAAEPLFSTCKTSLAIKINVQNTLKRIIIIIIIKLTSQHVFIVVQLGL